MNIDCTKINKRHNHQTTKLCSLFPLLLCILSSIGLFAQSTNRNNIESIEIHRADYYNPGSSGDVNPEKSNCGLIVVRHQKPTDSCSIYEFNLTKYISIDTLDKLIEKVGTNENDESVCIHRITRDTIYCHDYASVYPWLLSRVDTNQYLNCITKLIGTGSYKNVVVNIESIQAKGHSTDNYSYLFTKNKIYDWDNSTNIKSDLKKREVQYKLEDRVIFMDKKKKLYVYQSEKLIELNNKYINDMMNEEY